MGTIWRFCLGFLIFVVLGFCFGFFPSSIASFKIEFYKLGSLGENKASKFFFTFKGNINHYLTINSLILLAHISFTEKFKVIALI